MEIKTLAKMEKENGIATIDGAKYILIEQPYVDDIMQGYSSRTMYNAHAVREGDALDEYGYMDLYIVRWTPKPGFEEIEDESNACDWDNPEECERENGLGYNPETGRIA